MLRYSLVIATTGAYLLSALLWWLGLKPFRRTVDHVEAALQPVVTNRD
jgi:type II secretory pathway component PulM